MRDLPLERFARDAKLLEIGAGTSEIRRLLVARELLGPEFREPSSENVLHESL
jgi:alkylation response protein AidB-like acyl-CoA dehydrogenase